MLFGKTKMDGTEKISTKSDFWLPRFKKNSPSSFINSVCFI